MSKTLDEIHKIREQIYEEERRLSKKELLKRIHQESEEFMKKYGLKLIRVEKKLIEV